MTLLELIHRVRSRLYDLGGDTGVVPVGFSYYYEADDSGCLWKNDELVGYANAACMELAHRLPIQDAEDNELTRITLRPGTARYPIDPRILAIDSVVLASSGLPLVKIHDAQDRSQWNDPRDTTYSEPSIVQQYRDDTDAMTLTVYATPTVVDTLILVIKRLPLEPLTWAHRKWEIEEFPPHLQEALISWACMQALLKRDSDTYDKEAAGYHQGQFSDMVGPRINFRHARILKDVAGKRLRSRTYY